MQPELKAAGFDMTIKNTSADNLFGVMLPGGDLPGRHLHREPDRDHARAVLGVLHREHPRHRRTTTPVRTGAG